MARPRRLKKQYKAVGFGDGHVPGSVEAHRAALREAREERQADKDLQAIVEASEAAKPNAFTRFIRVIGMLITRRYKL